MGLETWSWSRDRSRPLFEVFGLGLGLDPAGLGLGLGLGLPGLGLGLGLGLSGLGLGLGLGLSGLGLVLVSDSLVLITSLKRWKSILTEISPISIALSVA